MQTNKNPIQELKQIVERLQSYPGPQSQQDIDGLLDHARRVRDRFEVRLDLMGTRRPGEAAVKAGSSCSALN